MATAEWVLSDDWKRWRDAKYSHMNPFKGFRVCGGERRAFRGTICTVWKLSLLLVLSAPVVCWLWSGGVVNKQIGKRCICVVFPLWGKPVVVFTQSSRLVQRCFLLYLLLVLKGKSKLNVELVSALLSTGWNFQAGALLNKPPKSRMSEQLWRPMKTPAVTSLFWGLARTAWKFQPVENAAVLNSPLSD